jgi:hypothetical protein
VNIAHRKKIVVLGMMTKMPVAGVVWQTAHYLVGLQRLGFDVYYVEDHARTPSMFMETEQCDGSGKAAAFIAGVMRRFDIGADRWCYRARHDDGRYYGLSEALLLQLYRDAAMIINLHGGTEPLPEHYATGRLVYLETDPVQLQIELYERQQFAIDFLKPHCAFFTYGENYGRLDCKLPVTDLFKFHPTRQPVVMDFWEGDGSSPAEAFTTIGNWEQQWRTVKFKGESYYWSKHLEFQKVIDLPLRTTQPLELALASYTPEVQQRLQGYGWRVRDAMEFSMDNDRYRDYIQSSRGEFTVAKDQNVRLRSGWFSDRAVTYLAAGRPVITQETGFSNIFPTGQGLFAFSTADEVLTAIDAVNRDYDGHRRAARGIAREYFAHDVVLRDLVNTVGI